MKKINWKVLIISLVIVYLVAGIGSLITSSATKTEWYQAIKPKLTPPNFVFPIVWTVLFFLIGLSLYFAWTSGKKNDNKKIALVFAINLILNILWSILYFKLKNPLIAFFELILLWFSIILMIAVVRKTSKLAAYLLIPYLLWVSFAGILNYLSI